jgi:hypothetical protein
LVRAVANRDATSAAAAVNLLFENDWLESLLALPECTTPRFRNQRAGRGVETVPVDVRGLLAAWIRGVSVTRLGVRYLSAVRDREFRLEELGDFVTSVFETSLPWVLGIVIDWANQSLAAQSDRDLGLICPSLPAYVRYGVNSDIAVELMRSGVTDRALALRISAGSQSANSDNPRAWLCSLSLDEWLTALLPSPLDLRVLLDFARRPGAAVLPRLLDGETVSLRMDSLASAEQGAFASIRRNSPGSLRVWVREEFIGQVPTEEVGDLEALLAAGLPLVYGVRHDDGKSFLDVRLA